MLAHVILKLFAMALANVGKSNVRAFDLIKKHEDLCSGALKEVRALYGDVFNQILGMDRWIDWTSSSSEISTALVKGRSENGVEDIPGGWKDEHEGMGEGKNVDCRKSEGEEEGENENGSVRTR